MEIFHTEETGLPGPASPEDLVTIRGVGHTVHVAGVTSELLQGLPALQPVDPDCHIEAG